MILGLATSVMKTLLFVHSANGKLLWSTTHNPLLWLFSSSCTHNSVEATSLRGNPCWWEGKTWIEKYGIGQIYWCIVPDPCPGKPIQLILSMQLWYSPTCCSRAGFHNIDYNNSKVHAKAGWWIILASGKCVAMATCILPLCGTSFRVKKNKINVW